MKRKYIVLLNITNSSGGRKVAAQAKAIDASHKVVWIDSSYAGILLETDLIASDIFKEVTKNAIFETDFKDIAVFEVGQDWCARRESNIDHWMSTHVGRPLLKR